MQGTGFDTAKGIYVSLCFIAADLRPGPCASGSAGQSAWISSNPPDYGKSLATPYAADGSFDVTLTLDPVIDAEHDCAKVACAIATRNDDTHAEDRSQDLLLPVSFAAVGNTELTVPRADPDFDANRTIPFAVGVAFVAAAGVLGWRYRRNNT